MVLRIVAGWHDDGSGRQRWWDGATWTEQVLPERPTMQPTSTAPLPAKQFPPGWYLDGSGVNRSWTGSKWGQSAQTDAPRSEELRPLTFVAPARKLVLVGTTCGLFSVGGLLLLATGGILEKFGGLLAIAFFGVFGFIATRTMWRQRTIFTLTQEGVKPQAGGFIPWDDIEAVGIGRLVIGPGTKIIGIRLKQYDRYLASFTPEQLQKIASATKWGRVAGLVTLPLAAPDEIMMAVAKRDLGELSQLHLLSIPQNDLAKQLKWTRDGSGGWDVAFSPLTFDRSSDKVVRDIENYREAVLQRRLNGSF